MSFLQIHTDWPSSLRNKGVYFVKRDKVFICCFVCIFLHLSCSCICQEGQGYTWLDLTKMIWTFPGADSPSGRGLEQQGDERAAPQLPHLRRCSPQCAWLVSGHLTSISFMNIYLLKNLTNYSSEHFCAWVEEVIVPLFKNESNICKFPKCLADDIKRQVRFIFRLAMPKTFNWEYKRCTSLQRQSIRSADTSKERLCFPSLRFCKENGKVEKNGRFCGWWWLRETVNWNLAAQGAVYIEDEERKVNT